MKNNIDIIKQFHNFLANGNKQAAINLITPDAVWHSDNIGAPWSGTFEGIEEIKKHFAASGKHIAAQEPSGKKFFNQLYLADDKYVAEIGTLKIKFNHNQEKFTNDYICLYKIENGKITSFKVFEDSMELYRIFSK